MFSLLLIWIIFNLGGGSIETNESFATETLRKQKRSFFLKTLKRKVSILLECF